MKSPKPSDGKMEPLSAVFEPEVAPEGGREAGAPSWKHIMPIGEIITRNCVLRLRKVPSTLLYSPLSENLAPRRANPGAPVFSIFAVCLSCYCRYRQMAAYFPPLVLMLDMLKSDLVTYSIKDSDFQQ